MMSARTLVLCGLLLVPAAAQAQTIHGVVVEDVTGEAIADAQVELVGPDGGSLATARTDRAGAFLLRLRRAGAFTVRLTHLSYTAVESEPVEVGLHEAISVELRMARTAIPLEPLVVTARADSRGIGGFHERRRRPGAVGHFITRDEIDRRRGARATELLKTIPGVYLVPVGLGGVFGNIILMRGLGITEQHTAGGDVAHTVTDRCEPTIYVDGVRVAQAPGDTGTLDSVLKPNVLEAVEVYPRGSTAPSPLLARSDCGVVAFWTREDGLGGFSWRKLAAWAGGMVVVFTLAR